MTSEEAQGFISQLEGRIEEAKKEIEFLRKIDFPVFVRGFTNDGRSLPLLATKDYSVANKFNIESKRKYDLSHSQSSPDRGYQTYDFTHYPEFSVAVSGTIIPVMKNFSVTAEEQEIDSKIIFLNERVVETSGEMYQKYQRSPVVTYPNSIEDVCSYLQEQGVKDSLVKRFKTKAQQTKGLIARNCA